MSTNVGLCVLQLRTQLTDLQHANDMKQKLIDTLQAKALKQQKAIKDGQLQLTEVKLSKGGAEKKVGTLLVCKPRVHAALCIYKLTHHALRPRPQALPLPCALLRARLLLTS